MVVVKFLPRAEKDLLKLPPLIQDDILRRVEFLSDFPLMGQKMDRASGTAHDEVTCPAPSLCECHGALGRKS